MFTILSAIALGELSLIHLQDSASHSQPQEESLRMPMDSCRLALELGFTSDLNHSCPCMDVKVHYNSAYFSLSCIWQVPQHFDILPGIRPAMDLFSPATLWNLIHLGLLLLLF